MKSSHIALANKLLEIQAADQKGHYNNRTFFTYQALAMAISCGYSAGIRIDSNEPEWPVAFIELPTGQISYHLEQHSTPWDSHTTEQKKLRILEYIANVQVE
jgi:hypothetical protein